MQNRQEKINAFIKNKDAAIARELFDISDKLQAIDLILSRIDADELEYLKGDSAPEVTDERLRALIAPLIPPPIAGESVVYEDVIDDLMARIKIPVPQNGRDADEDAIVSRVLSEIKVPEPKVSVVEKAMYETREQLRDKLESLVGDERLNIKHIAGWEEIYKELKALAKTKAPVIMSGASRLSVHNHEISKLTFGTGFTVTYGPGEESTVELDGGGGGGSPGGSNKQLQYNNSGAFGGIILEYSLSGADGVLAIPNQTIADTYAANFTFQGGKGKGTGGGSSFNIYGGDDEVSDNYGAVMSIGGGVPSGVGGAMTFTAGQGVYNGGSISFTGGNASDATGVGGDLLFGAGTGTVAPGSFGIIQPGTTNKALFNLNRITGDRTLEVPDISGVMAIFDSTTSIANNILYANAVEGQITSNGIFKFVASDAELRIGNYLGAFNGSVTGGVLGANKGISIVEDIADYNAATYTKSYATIKTDVNIASIDLWAADGAGGSMTIESTNSGSAIIMNGTAGSITLSTDSNTLFFNNGLFGISNNGATRTGFFDMGALTGAANRVFAFPDQSGKVALTANPTDITVPTEAYGAGWSGSAEVPTKGDLYTKIQSMGGGGGITRSVSTVTSDTTAGATASTDYVYFCDGMTLTLPTAVGNTNTYTITRISAETVFLETTGGELIYGTDTSTGYSTLEIVDRYTQLTLYSDGTNWYY